MEPLTPPEDYRDPEESAMTTTKLDDFTPRWASPPGDTIKTVLDERGWSLDEFAPRLAIDVETLENLLSGVLPLNIEIARNLSKSLGASVEFWMSRDLQYREDLSRLEATRLAESLPIRDMTALGWIPRTSNWKDRLAACLDFFGVPDMANWEQRYGQVLQAAYFRSSSAHKQNREAVVAWLRRAEIAADSITTVNWNRDSFNDSLPEIRHLTKRDDPQDFVPRLVAICAESGVAVSVVRALKGCPVSGAARFISRERAMIALSARYLSDDHFWFTFFHEAGHLVLHNPSRIFVDDLSEFDTSIVSEIELQANEFASQVLVPGGIESFLQQQQFTHRDVIRLANAVGTSPGVVLGQIQHVQLRGYDKMNYLKRRYTWNGSILEKARI